MNRSALMAVLFFAPVLATAQSSTTSLSSSDELQRVVGAINTQWGDGNISTGTTSMKAAKLRGAVPESKSELKELAEEIFAQQFKYFTDSELPSNARVRSSAGRFSSSDVKNAARAVAEGNAFSPDNSDSANSISRAIWASLRKLGAEDSIQTASIKTRINKDGDSEDPRNIYFFLFLNGDSKKLVTIFVIEGTM